MSRTNMVANSSKVPDGLSSSVTASEMEARLLRVAAEQLSDCIQFAEKNELDCTAALGVVRSSISGKNFPGNDTVRQINGACNEAIRALQFVDALVQRLTHVRFSLEEIATCAGVDTADTPVEWCRVSAKVASIYSMSREHDVFDSVMGGSSHGDVPGMESDNARGSGGGGVDMF
jgi:hypothetical protein